MKFLIVVFLNLFFAVSYGQIVISGKLLDMNNNPLPNVNVSYKKVGGIAVLGFSKSNSEGNYQTIIKITDVDSIQLEFSHLGFARKTIILPLRAGKYNYILEHAENRLKEVRVANIPIYKKKDTINYDVGSFTSKRDRVIADIIRKLPGVEIQGNQILYQGKPIQKYTVNKLDLMDGRYGIINNNLPADAVKSVQVIENDQPIKLLDSLVFSDRATINLELKKYLTTGTGTVGVGAKPTLWELNLTPMTFNKTFQALNSLQSNNIGKDVSRDLDDLYFGGGYLNNSKSKISDGPSYLNIQSVASPGFEETKWLDNRIFLFSSNVLKKLKSGLELKGNVSYFNDLQKRKGFTSTEYYTFNNTIYNSEAVDNSSRKQVFDIGLLLEKNAKKSYFRNILKYHKGVRNNNGNLLFNNSDHIFQQNRYNDEAFINSTSLAKKIGGQLVDVQSTFQFHNTPQHLIVNPGQFKELLNEGNNYDELSQFVRYKGISWDNNIGAIRKFNNFIFSSNIFFNYEQKQLHSFIDVREKEESTILGSEYKNEMKNDKLSTGVNLRAGWENNRWKIYVLTPITSMRFNVKQQNFKVVDNEHREVFTPSFGVTFLGNEKNDLSFQIAKTTEFGDLNNLYNGYIIGFYRSIQRYETRLLKNEGHNLQIGYNFKNVLEAVFANFNYGYKETIQDYIFDTTIDSLGRTSVGISDQESTGNNHSISSKFSKYFPKLKMVIKLNGSVNYGQNDILINGIFNKQRFKSESIGIEVIDNLSSIFSVEYKTVLSWSERKFNSNKQHIFYNNHYFNSTFDFLDKHSIQLRNSLYLNNIIGDRRQYFLDANYRYHLKKWNTDVELTIQNLLNNRDYSQQFSSNTELIQSRFELRQRQFLLSMKFKF